MDAEVKAVCAAPHVSLMEAINTSLDVKCELAGLLANINGKDLPDGGDASADTNKQPSLVEVLHNGPNLIHENTKQCLSLIEELRRALLNC